MNTSQWKLIATLLKNWILWALGKTWLLAPYFSEGTQYPKCGHNSLPLLNKSFQ